MPEKEISAKDPYPRKRAELLGTSMLQTWSKGLPGPVAALALIQVLLVALVLALGLGWTLRKKARRHA